MSSSDRFRYSQDQLEQYFDRLAIPKSKRVYNVTTLNNDDQMQYLKTILKHHVVRIPFENLVQHYSWHRVIDVSPLHLFRKVTGQPGRGGYCMELNQLLHVLLYSLGFSCYMAAGRVWIGPEQKWTGWSHLVNIVTVGGLKYLCDVGFGSNEPLSPLQLIDGANSQHVPPAESKLVYQRLEQNLSDSKLWVHMFRPNRESEWTTVYCFTETEILPTDIPGLNYAPWLNPRIIFTQKVVSVRQTTDKEVDEPGMASEEAIDTGSIDGTLIIDHDSFKWRRRGETVLSRQFQLDDERLEALKKYFGIELDVEDREAILGTTAAIPSKES